MSLTEPNQFLLFSLDEAEAVDRFFPAELVLDDLWPRVRDARVSRAVIRAFWLAATDDPDAERQLRDAVAGLDPTERRMIRRHCRDAFWILGLAALARALRAAAEETP